MNAGHCNVVEQRGVVSRDVDLTDPVLKLWSSRTDPLAEHRQFNAVRPEIKAFNGVNRCVVRLRVSGVANKVTATCGQIDVVGSFAAPHGIITCAHENTIGPTTRFYHIVCFAADECVITGPAHERHCSSRCRGINSCIHTICTGRGCANLRSSQCNFISARHCYINSRTSTVMRNNICTNTSVSDGIGTCPSIDDISTIITGNLVIASVAIDGIGSRATLQRIVASTTGQ